MQIVLGTISVHSVGLCVVVQNLDSTLMAHTTFELLEGMSLFLLFLMLAGSRMYLWELFLKAWISKHGMPSSKWINPM